jgi:hypothetical protein
MLNFRANPIVVVDFISFLSGRAKFHLLVTNDIGMKHSIGI